MWTTEKDILYPGNLFVDGQWIEITQQDIANAAAVGNAKLRQYQVPACWEHDPKAVPLGLSAAAQRARSVFGWIDSYRVENGVLKATIRGEDDSELSRLKSAKYVSPYIHWDWRGSDGKTWPGLNVLHVAATPIPVQNRQQSFQLSLSKSKKRALGPIFLSVSNYQVKPMADEPTNKEGGEGSGKDYFKDALEKLAMKGINLPEDTTPENVWERIVVACMQGESEELEEPEEPTEPEVQVNNEPPMTGMALSNAEKKSLERAVALSRKELLGRIEEVVKSGRITPQIAEKLKAEASAVKLSFNTDGELKTNSVLAKIEAYEALPESGTWSKRANLSHATAVDSPMVPNGDLSKDKEVLDAWDKTK